MPTRITGTLVVEPVQITGSLAASPVEITGTLVARNGRDGEAPSLGSYVRGESISGARAVRLAVDGGVTKVYRASATTPGQAAAGFVKEAGDAGAAVTVWRVAAVTGLSGIVPGAEYYLGANGEFATEPPAGAVTVQALGLGVSATALFGDVGEPVTVV